MKLILAAILLFSLFLLPIAAIHLLGLFVGVPTDIVAIVSYVLTILDGGVVTVAAINVARRDPE